MIFIHFPPSSNGTRSPASSSPVPAPYSLFPLPNISPASFSLMYQLDIGDVFTPTSWVSSEFQVYLNPFVCLFCFNHLHERLFVWGIKSSNLLLEYQVRNCRYTPLYMQCVSDLYWAWIWVFRAAYEDVVVRHIILGTLWDWDAIDGVQGISKNRQESMRIREPGGVSALSFTSCGPDRIISPWNFFDMVDIWGTLYPCPEGFLLLIF